MGTWYLLLVYLVLPRARAGWGWIKWPDPPDKAAQFFLVTVQSQDSAARSRADCSHSRRTHTSPQPAGICHHLQAQSQPALGGMRSRKVKSKQFEIIHFAKLDRDLQSPLLPEISHRNSRTFCGENHFVERVQIAMKKLQQSFFFFS